MPLHSSLGDSVRLCLKKKNDKRKRGYGMFKKVLEASMLACACTLNYSGGQGRMIA